MTLFRFFISKRTTPFLDMKQSRMLRVIFTNLKKKSTYVFPCSSLVWALSPEYEISSPVTGWFTLKTPNVFPGECPRRFSDSDREILHASSIVVVVVVLTLTRIIKSVVTGQAPVTLELRNTPGKKTHNPRWYTHISQLTQFMPLPETYKSEVGSQSTMCQERWPKSGTPD